MKKLLIIFCLLFTVSVISAQEPSRVAVQGSDVVIKDGDPTPSFKLINTIEFPGLDKTTLFNLSEAWLSETFRAGTVTNNRTTNVDAGFIIEKTILGYYYQKKRGNTNMMSRCTGNIHYTLKIEVKDGKIRFTGDNYLHQSVDWNMFGTVVHYDLGRITTAEIKDPKWPNYKKKCWLDAKKQIEDAYNILKTSLTDYINSGSKNSNDNW